MKIILIYVCLLLFTLSCRKGEDAAKVSPDFVGTWRLSTGSNSYNILEIEDFGKSSYQECFSCAGSVCDCHEPSLGKAKINNNKLYIGFLPKFKIDKMPYKSGMNWYMVLDGKTWSQ